MTPIPEPTLWTFLLQGLMFGCLIPVSVIAYQIARVPQRRAMDQRDMLSLGITNPDQLPEMLSIEHRLRDFALPVLVALAMVISTYALTHPYTIRTGIGAGVLESVIQVFDTDDTIPPEVAIGRTLFWGWAGAWVYSVNLIFRRYLAYDLTPSVYIFVINRFLWAWVIGAVVGLSLGMSLRTAGVPPNTALSIVSVTLFFVGVFPDIGWNWLITTVRRTLRRNERISDEIPLSCIEGLSIWHQGRLNQESIDNAQNLAMTMIPKLVFGTPYPLGQIIDWIDQAILMVYVEESPRAALRKVGIRCASDFLAARTDPNMLELIQQSTQLSAERLQLLTMALSSAVNMRIIARTKWKWSTDPTRVEQARQLTELHAEIADVRSTLTLPKSTTPQEITAVKAEQPALESGAIEPS